MFGSRNKSRNNQKINTSNSLDSLPITTLIGSEIEVEGNIKGENTIKIDGKVTGDIIVSKGVVLGEKGVVYGKVISKHVIIHGKIEGGIHCEELILKSTGSIDGDMLTKTIEIEMGGKYNGRLDMRSSTEIPLQDAKPPHEVVETY